jgi:phosphoribosylformylglycinamidine synthase
LIGHTKEELGASEYYLSYHRSNIGIIPKVDLAEDKGNALAVSNLISSGVVKCAHDCSKGGIAVALAELAINGDTGFDVDISLASNTCNRMDSLMFSESNSRYVVSTERPKELVEILRNSKRQVHCKKIGYADDSSSNDIVQYRKGHQSIAKLELNKLKLAYNSSLESMLNNVSR